MIVPGGLIPEVITWVRRIVKPDSDAALTEDTILSYLNRFYMYDMPQEIQLFELTQRYSFDTIPNTNYYPFPPRDSAGNITQDIILIQPPIYCDGVQIGFFQSDYQFYRAFPEQVYNSQVATGDDSPSIPNFTLTNYPIQRTFNQHNLTNIPDPFSSTLPYITIPYVSPALIISSINSLGNSVYLIDDGFGSLNQVTNGFQEIILPSAGTINYLTGAVTNATFLDTIPSGTPIYCQSLPYQPARPIAVLLQSGYLKTYPISDKPYKIDIDCMISPAQFLSSSESVPYAYMAEYIARGTARKILLDTGDMQQLQLYEKPFKEQQLLVLRRSSKQRQVDRVPTIFSTYIGYPLFYQLQ